MSEDDKYYAAIEARIQSFELAYRMQMDAADAFDISREPRYIREMYGAEPGKPPGRRLDGAFR